MTRSRLKSRAASSQQLVIGTFCLISIGLGLNLVLGQSGRGSESLDRTLPSTYSNGCHLPSGEFEPLPCLSTQNAELPTIYLVGDSHAAQWIPAIESKNHSAAIKFRFLTKSSCPFVPLKLNADCDQWVSNVLREIIENKPNLVVISNLTNGKYLNFYEDQTYSNFWISNFDPLLKEISKLTEILIIEDTPYSSFDSSECLISRSQMDCEFGFIESQLTSTIRSYAAENNFYYKSFNDYLCFNLVCNSGDSKINYYRDENHISVSLSKRFGPTLHNFLQGLIFNK